MNVAGDPTMFLRTAARISEGEHPTLFAAITDSPGRTSSAPRRRRLVEQRTIAEYVARFFARHHYPRTAS